MARVIVSLLAQADTAYRGGPNVKLKHYPMPAERSTVLCHPNVQSP